MSVFGVPLRWAAGVVRSRMLLVFAGGTVGTAARYLVGEVVESPWSTLCVNVAGAFLLGLLTVVLERVRPGSRLRWLLGAGVLGGFTTYSALAVHTVSFGSVSAAVGYVVATVVLGVLACWGGNVSAGAVSRRGRQCGS